MVETEDKWHYPSRAAQLSSHHPSPRSGAGHLVRGLLVVSARYLRALPDGFREPECQHFAITAYDIVQAKPYRSRCMPSTVSHKHFAYPG